MYIHICIDWCCFYYFVKNGLVALLKALCARVFSWDLWISGFFWHFFWDRPWVVIQPCAPSIIRWPPMTTCHILFSKPTVSTRGRSKRKRSYFISIGLRREFSIHWSHPQATLWHAVSCPYVAYDDERFSGKRRMRNRGFRKEYVASRHWRPPDYTRCAGLNYYQGTVPKKNVRKTLIFTNLKKRFEHIELSAKLLDYFLRSNKSNINQRPTQPGVLWVYAAL